MGGRLFCFVFCAWDEVKEGRAFPFPPRILIPFLCEQKLHQNSSQIHHSNTCIFCPILYFSFPGLFLPALPCWDLYYSDQKEKIERKKYWIGNREDCVRRERWGGKTVVYVFHTMPHQASISLSQKLPHLVHLTIFFLKAKIILCSCLLSTKSWVGEYPIFHDGNFFNVLLNPT